MKRIWKMIFWPCRFCLRHWKPLVLLGCGMLFFLYGRYVTYKDQWPLYEAVRTTSAIAFGVMGAWIGILCPNILTRLFGHSNKPINTEEEKNIAHLRKPLLLSSFILITILFSGVLAPILKSLVTSHMYITWLRGISYVLVGELTLLQIYAIVLTFVPSDIIDRFLKRHKKWKDTRQKMSRLTQIK